jgi:hypothetical protein
MGGPEMRKKYDSLLKTIQKALKKQATGLAVPQTAKATKPATVPGGK